MNDTVKVLEQNGKILYQLNFAEALRYLGPGEQLNYYGQVRTVAYKTLTVEDGDKASFSITVNPLK